MWRKKLIDKFGDTNINSWSALRYDGEKIIKEVMTEEPVRIAIEIGTCKGICSHYMAEFSEKVITIDMKKWDLLENIKTFLNKKNIEYKIIDVNNDLKEKEKILEENKKEIDFIFIDGAHGEGAITDTELCSKYCNRILIHDYKDGFGGPDRAVDMLVKKGWRLREYNLFAYLTK